jgi:hypothetical protein
MGRESDDEMRMAYYPSDFLGQVINYECDKCGKSGSRLAEELHAQYGRSPMPDIRYELAKQFGCHRGHDAPFNDKCQLSYVHTEEQRRQIDQDAKPKTTAATKISDLPQYVVLFALCPSCKRRKPLDRWEIQRSRRGLTLGELSRALRCRCGHKGASLLEGTASR